MNVFLYFKIKDPDDLTSRATRKGDLCYIYPVVNSKGEKHHQGNLTLDTHRPFVMDLTIPCGNDFLDLTFKCQTCQWNNPIDCDYRKYQRAIWSAGDVLNPPKIVSKTRYKISLTELDKMFGENIKTDFDTMTPEYKSNQFAVAEINIKTKVLLDDKVSI